MKTYDHTDAASSPMSAPVLDGELLTLLEVAREKHRFRMRMAFRQAAVDNRLLRPAETLALNPHTRIGY